jgi:hypothetical protein
MTIETWLRMTPPVASSPPFVTQELPIQAWATESNGARVVDFYDPDRILAEDGKLRASNIDYTLTNWLIPADLEPGTVVDASGIYVVQTFLWSSEFVPDSGILRGVLLLHTPATGAAFAYRFDLRKSAELTTCGSTCPSGETCTQLNGSSVCESGPPWAPATQGLDFTSARFTAWKSWLVDLETRVSAQIPDLRVGTCGDTRGATKRLPTSATIRLPPRASIRRSDRGCRFQSGVPTRTVQRIEGLKKLAERRHARVSRGRVHEGTRQKFGGLYQDRAAACWSTYNRKRSDQIHRPQSERHCGTQSRLKLLKWHRNATSCCSLRRAPSWRSSKQLPKHMGSLGRARGCQITASSDTWGCLGVLAWEPFGPR